MPLRALRLTDPAPRLVLDGLIDFAGLFPPAGSGMAEAVRAFAHYRAAGTAWMLGRFVCPATALDAFSIAADPYLPRDPGAIPWRLSVTGSGDVAADCAAIAAFNTRHQVCFDECSALADCYELRLDTVDAVLAADAGIPRTLTTYVEVPWTASQPELLAAVAACGRRGKMRTGGTVPEAFPTAAQVADFLAHCVALDLPAKATAGLHHPVAGPYRLTYAVDAPTGRMFGFLNVLLAATLLRQGGDRSMAITLLEDQEATHFAACEEQLTWAGPEGPVRFSRDLLQATRTGTLVSIGSCSFTEPVDESRALGFH